MFIYRLLLLIAATTLLNHVSAAADLQQMTFHGQLPRDTNVWTVPAAGTYYCQASLDDMLVQWKEPDSGVTTATGVLVMLHGIDAMSYCNEVFMEWGTPWANEKDVIVCDIYYRNIPFYPPYDFGIYQVTDVLRGLGELLKLYPDANLRRLYLMGSSGGGHVALQVLAFTPDLWAEVYAHSAITKITRQADVSQDYGNDPKPYGWNVNFCPPSRIASLSDSELDQLEAETALRSPQGNFANLGNAAELPTKITMFHGTADPVTDYRHLVAMEEVIESTTQLPAQILDHPGAVGIEVGNWRFWMIENGDHIYGGALPALSNRGAATNSLCPDAFLAEKTTPPSLYVDSILPKSGQFTYQITGYLDTCNVDEIIDPASINNWELY